MKSLSSIAACAITFQAVTARAEVSTPRSVKPGSLSMQSAGKAFTPELEVKVRWPQTVEISPDGTQVLTTIKESSYEDNASSTQVYLIPVQGGETRQLTFSGKSNSEAVFSPDGTKVAFTGARDEASQIYVLDLQKGGEAKRLTDLPTGASGPIFSPDGKLIAFVSAVYPDCKDFACNKARADAKAKNRVRALAYDELLYRHWNAWDEGTRSHVFVMPADGGEPAIDLTPGKHHVPSETLNEGRGYAFASNDTIVYCANLDSNAALSTNNDLFSVSVRGGPPKPLTAQNKALDSNPIPSPDKRSIAYVAFSRPGFESDRAALTVLDRASGKTVARTESFDRRVDEIAWMADSSGLWLTAYDHGRIALFSVGRESGEVAPVLAEDSIENLSASEKGTIAFSASSIAHPPEIFTYDPAAKKRTQISHLNDALARATKLGKAEDFEVDDKGTKVHGFIVYPPDFNPKNRYPLVLILHGGPQGASNDSWHPRWNAQLFAAKGYVVAMPNFRGSIGYGQKFIDAVSKDWGGGPYEDVMAFTDALAKKPFIDARWMCAAGASYGGYMINWIAGHTDRFRCLITHAGVFNLESMWGDTEELWFPEWEFAGTPWAARDTYRRWSPHEYIQNAKTPTLVIHGQLDYRVQLSQGQQMFTSLKRLGVPARFVYFPDEGHFVTKPQNYVYWYNEMLGWLARYLR
jgi:dipeptidyl aminopeptidase/acylaminoacyl peptidase